MSERLKCLRSQVLCPAFEFYDLGTGVQALSFGSRLCLGFWRSGLSVLGLRKLDDSLTPSLGEKKELSTGAWHGRCLEGA